MLGCRMQLAGRPRSVSGGPRCERTPGRRLPPSTGRRAGPRRAAGQLGGSDGKPGGLSRQRRRLRTAPPLTSATPVVSAIGPSRPYAGAPASRSRAPRRASLVNGRRRTRPTSLDFVTVVSGGVGRRSSCVNRLDSSPEM